MSDFDFLILHLSSEAMLFMGLWAPEGAEEHTNLPAARKLIDALACLQDKTKWNLAIEEQRLLENTVTELRFRYVQAFEAARKKQAEPAEKAQAEAPPAAAAGEKAQAEPPPAPEPGEKAQAEPPPAAAASADA